MTFGVLAAAAPASDIVTPGLLGFLVFAVMAVVLVFLLKSMNKQFRKITPKAEGRDGQRRRRIQDRPRRAARAGNPQVGRLRRFTAQLSYPLVSVGEGAIGSTSCG